MRLLLTFSILLVPLVAFPHNASADTVTASDNFNRADGGLGSGWTAVSDGAMSISSQAVAGVGGATTGDIRTAETYGSDQFSQVEVTSAQLSGGQWVGPAVRMQNGGQDAYLGIYFWNSGSPALMLFVRKAGGWQQLSAATTGPLAAGTQLKLTAVGSTISFLVNGVQQLSVTDTTLTGGAPGILAHDHSTADNWAGGAAGTGGGGTSSYTVGGTASGLSGTLVLRDNGGDDLTVGGNGPFTFATPVAAGAGYQVTVKTSPAGQTCQVTGGSGTIAAANVTNVAVSCTSGGGGTSSYTVGGTASGLSGTLVLRDNGGDDLTVGGNGPFTFATPVAAGAGYQVTVKTSPAGQTCQVTGGSGTIAAANVTNVAVSCTTAPADTVTASDNFNRADGGLGSGWTAVSDGAMSISSQAVAGVGGATTGDIRTAETYGSDQFSQVEVTSAQLSGGQWVGPAVRMQNGGQDAYLGIYFWNSGSPALMLFVRKAGGWQQLSAATTGPLAAGTQLKLTAVGSTISFLVNGVQQLSVTDTTLTGGAPGILAHDHSTADNWAGGAAGTGGGGTSSYTVGGTASGLSGTLVLRDNGGDDLTVGGNGPFTFATPVAAGAGYQVTVKTSPAGQTCQVTGGSGTIAAANVTNVAVSCTSGGGGTSSYTVGGTASGLSGTLVLRDNGGDDLTVGGNGPFTFATPVAAGAGYQVTVKTSPAGQTCQVTGGSGTIAAANVTNVAVSCTTAPADTVTASDNFNRADGGLGSGWTAVSDGAMSISSQAVAGVGGATTGDIRTAETYGSDQFSQVEVTSAQLSGGQWVGPAVRMQNGGQDAYLGIYFWNSGSPALMLFVRKAGGWQQLSAATTGPLAAGTQLKLTAVGSTISFLVNGVQQLSVTDTTLTGGAPGILAHDHSTADNWAGGAAGTGGGGGGGGGTAFQATYVSTDAQGIKTYNVTSDDNGPGMQTMRVLAPTNPAAGVAHNFLIVLPVEAGQGTTFGDGIGTMAAANAQNQYNLTIIEPGFAIDPWYADNPNSLSVQYETFMTQDLMPWIQQNLGTTGNEQTWLIGFSKSGLGAQDLILKHPDVFTLAASWDFPADMSAYDQYGSAAGFGTDANFQANYRLTQSFVDARKAPFVSNNRIWIGGYQSFQADVSDYDALLTSEGIKHTTETPQLMLHRWDSGWVSIALAALYQDSVNLH